MIKNSGNHGIKNPIYSSTNLTSLKQDVDGREIANVILRNLPQSECNLIYPLLEFVRLTLRQVMHEVGETIRSVYFLNDGLGSVLAVQPDGKSVEVALVGNEGFVGQPVIFGFKTSGLRVVNQGEGSAYRLDVDRSEEHTSELQSLRH